MAGGLRPPSLDWKKKRFGGKNRKFLLEKTTRNKFKWHQWKFSKNLPILLIFESMSNQRIKPFPLQSFCLHFLSPLNSQLFRAHFLCKHCLLALVLENNFTCWLNEWLWELANKKSRAFDFYSIFIGLNIWLGIAYEQWTPSSFLMNELWRHPYHSDSINYYKWLFAKFTMIHTRTQSDLRKPVLTWTIYVLPYILASGQIVAVTIDDVRFCKDNWQIHGWYFERTHITLLRKHIRIRTYHAYHTYHPYHMKRTYHTYRTDHMLRTRNAHDLLSIPRMLFARIVSSSWRIRLSFSSILTVNRSTVLRNRSTSISEITSNNDSTSVFLTTCLWVT